ncbi:hypothetical protein MCOR28_004295 [Pyricularia oryzae]|nr:hypothetical protein MCOR26_003812 [Pyricularia oryzae]KAI6344304.1 hypothetical protein MCOR28_004295 [Pyricularia oryzae]KAI6445904.1 hypothetical protein MCOR22_004075 [Pyricularia oryzae]KAI6445905.1 hypothetical protein MCOR22_004075 [Pyricularia oryzae]
MKAVLVTALFGQLARSSPRPVLPVDIDTKAALNSRLANVYLSTRSAESAPAGALTYTYGECTSESHQDAHHVIATASGPTSSGESRLAWSIPEDAKSGGCISAWDSAGRLVGRSGPQTMHPSRSRKAKRGIVMSQTDGFDTLGPWFDGVAHLEAKNLSVVDAEAAKASKVGIVGAGMSGLMTYLVLTQAGMKNLEIIEASSRLGGRVHTAYLSGGPSGFQNGTFSYQEMGPMRFPATIELNNQTLNISDHQLVFDLAEEMNRLNGHSKNLSIDFIPWYQSSQQGLSYKNSIKLPSGIAPTLAEVAQNASLRVDLEMDDSTAALSAKVDALETNEEFYAEIANNMHKAHSDFIHNKVPGEFGGRWSEFGYMVNYLNQTLNDTSMVVGSGSSDFWDTLYEGMYFTASTYKTVNGGLNRIPESFHPLVDNATTMGRKIERVQRDKATGKVTLQWRDSFKDAQFKSSTYDYAVLGVPFSVLKNWRFSPPLIGTIANAIAQVPYNGACKIALEFSERFWETKLPNPIYGSCSTTTDIPGIGSICYPSYDINGTGPASILASYISSDQFGIRMASLSEEEHVQYVLDAMLEIHGPAAEGLYTGKYNRKCWYQDPLESGSWASPLAGQHELFIPEYFKTHDGVIFVGEHTSYTHAWISSALESGIRGGVQLLLELGLVDEAKAIVDKWMARWIEI